MKSLILESIERLTLREIPVPDPGPGEILLKVTHCALCRTDAKMWRHGHRDLAMPRVLGHEIRAVDPATGKAYAVWPGKACGQCAACLRGDENLCARMEITGFHRDGGFAEWIAAPRESLIGLDRFDAGAAATLAEPLGCCFNAMEKLAPRPGEQILIFGAGPVGLLMALAARHAGAHPFLVEINETKLKSASGYIGRIGAEIGSRVPNRVFDAAVNAAPNPAILKTALTVLRPGGRFCVFSGLPSGGAFPVDLINEIHYRELAITGAYGCARRHMMMALECLHGEPEVANLLIEKEIKLDEVPRSLQAILNGESTMKRVVRFRDAAENGEE